MSKLIDLVVLRHASTLWNEQRKYQGKADIPLSDNGRNFLRARKTPDHFLYFEKVSSPLSRATETADILGLKPYSLEPRLMEADFGSWEGRAIEDIRMQIDYGDLKEGWGGTQFKPHGGESIYDLQKRIAPWLLERASLGKPTLAVCHKGIIMAMMGLALKWEMWEPSPQKVDYQTLQWLQINDKGELSVKQLNVAYEMRK
ncbi:MAG: histidine phosphatase family protein [Pseudobdellovibrionaceae bacterium]